MKRGLAAAVLGSAALAGGSAMALPRGLPYTLRADRQASYVMDCKFRAIRVIGSARINQYRVQYRGPTHGNLPSDNARCVLTKVSGPGAVVLTLTKNGHSRSVRAAQAGAPVQLTVL
jgi:hypothetical protein